MRSISPTCLLAFPALATLAGMLWLGGTPVRGVGPQAAALAGEGASVADYYRKAQDYLDQRDYQQARKAAEIAVRLDPRSARCEALLGTAEYALGNLSAAEKYLQAALQLDPKFTSARRTLAEALLKQKRFRDAETNFRAVLLKQPADFVAIYGLGLALLLDNRPADALRQFDKALQLKPQDAGILTGILQARVRLKQQAQASATLAELDDRLDENQPRREQIAALLVSEGAYELAAQEFERLHKAHPESYETSYNLALAYHRTGKDKQARALLQGLLARGEKAELEDLLGEVEEGQADNDAAARAFQRAAELDPQNEDYRFDYASALVREGVINEALQAFSAAASDFPRSMRMRLGWGATYYLVGRYTEAVRTLLRSADMAPRTPEVYYLLGRAYDAAGPLQEAIAGRFAAYLSARPNDAWGQFFYGKILASAQPDSSHRLREAQYHLERAIVLDANLAEAHVELGGLFEKRGRLEEAQQELERAVKIDPQFSTAYYKLAEVYRRLGESAQAKQASDRFQQLKAQERQDSDREHVQGFFERTNR